MCFFSKLDYLSDKHNTYYNRCIICPWCKSEVVVADGAVFVKPTGTNDTLITSTRRKE